MDDETKLRPYCISITAYCKDRDAAIELGATISHKNQRESVSAYPLAPRISEATE